MVQIEKIHPVVMDGVTIGHPSCAVHGCRRALQSPKDRFCTIHKSHDGDCVVVGCSGKQEIGFRTCAIPEHREKESHLQAQNKAMFQLKHRLERLQVAQLKSSMPVEDFSEGDSTDEEIISKEAEPKGVNVQAKHKKQKKIRALMGRMHSHNEQLMVRPCGIIIGRCTCFGAESPEQVIVSPYHAR